MSSSSGGGRNLEKVEFSEECKLSSPVVLIFWTVDVQFALRNVASEPRSSS
jgi:hypothetical protein